MTTVTVSGFKIRKGERLYGKYVRYALYKATESQLQFFGHAIYILRSIVRLELQSIN